MSRCLAIAWLLCAWVLWDHFTVSFGADSSDEWRITTAERTQEECHAAAVKSIRWRASQKWPTRPGREPEKTVVEGDRVSRGNMSWRYLCLPDTVDPRAPKR
jgi:hypothetical protein